VLQVLKQTVSRVLRQNRTNGAEQNPFWQRRFYDFNVWSAKKVREKLQYMHDNPVGRKLVEHPKDWPWSSWSHYATQEPGLLEMDSLAEPKREHPHP